MSKRYAVRTNLTVLIPVMPVMFILCFCSAEEGSSGILEDRAVHSLATELRAIYDIRSLPEYLDSTFCAQVSTYDTTMGNDDGFSGRFSYIRKNKDGSLILFDIRGSGVINRIWTPTPTKDTLDDTLKPSFSICYMDLFSGRRYPSLRHCAEITWVVFTATFQCRSTDLQRLNLAPGMIKIHPLPWSKLKLISGIQGKQG